MAAPTLYAEPIEVNDPAICSFYHRTELPGCGTVGAQWDLRDTVDKYLGQLDFSGKRVLDIGAASGFLSFEMERRGAEVVSFDMRDGHDWNVVPHAHEQHYLPSIYEECDQAHTALRNAYWFAHQRLGSRCRAVYGDIYDLPGELGNFDIVFCGMILGHLRDPFLALYSASRLCSGTMVVTNPTSAREPWVVETAVCGQPPAAGNCRVHAHCGQSQPKILVGPVGSMHFANAGNSGLSNRTSTDLPPQMHR